MNGGGGGAGMDADPGDALTKAEVAVLLLQA